MPVVKVSLRRFAKMVGADRSTIIDRIPYIGLDIESVEGDTLRVEYSPNRPDFGTDWGIARSLRGALGKEVGLPEYKVGSPNVEVAVDPRLAEVRPYIACVSASGLDLDDEDVRQLISLQEDLHNGLGRRRKRVAVGLHDMRAIAPPLAYRAVSSSFSFVPLAKDSESSIKSILKDTEEGKLYGGALRGPLYPVITDSLGAVLSFPPIINGDATRVTQKTTSIFVDVTSTDEEAGDDVLSIVATTLAEAGGKLNSATIKYPTRSKVTPGLPLKSLPLDLGLVRGVLGLDLTRKQVASTLARSRLSLRGNKVVGPAYRIDLLHPVDVAEEVALGYGVDKMTPLYPASSTPGSFHPFQQFLQKSAEVMAGSGMLELMTYELVDEEMLYGKFGRPSTQRISVLNPKSIGHSILRDSLIPPLMGALSSNVKSDYPQRVFEVGRVYSRGSGVSESWHLGCLVAHSSSSFTESKTYLDAFCRTMGGMVPTSERGSHWAFSQGRTAAIKAGGVTLGHAGEVRPESIDSFGLSVPVSGFELDLTALHKLLK